MDRRHPALRWIVPVGAFTVAVAATAVTAAIIVSGTPRFGPPHLGPRALIAAVDTAQNRGYSGTLLAQMPLNFPMSAAATAAGSPIMLMTGTQSLRYWYGGPDRQRVALLARSSETDVFQVGDDLWQWDSQTRVASHTSLPAGAVAGPGAPVSPAPLTIATLTPQQLAVRTLAAVDENTELSVSSGRLVADRHTYELVLKPGEADRSRIAAVHIEVDARTKVPLGVQVYARGIAQPCLDVAFTSIVYKTPSPDYFEFSPPAHATVVRGVQPQLIAGTRDAGATTITPPHVPAITWSSITEYRTVNGAPAPTLAQAGDAMAKVEGAWGSGRLLETPLLCMLLGDDGRVFAGSVEPDVLYAAASAAP